MCVPDLYVIQFILMLRTRAKLYVHGCLCAETKEEFVEGCSVQVYSVQASVPKDPAVIWNAEFIQSEQLFKEPSNVINCLRDNRLDAYFCLSEIQHIKLGLVAVHDFIYFFRFCGVSNSFVKHNFEGTPVSSTGPPLKNAGISGQPSGSSFSNQTLDTSIRQEKKVEQLDPNPKPAVHKEQAPQVGANKKKAQNDKSSSGTASSLASMWGRATSKPKPESTSVKTDNVVPISNGLFTFQSYRFS